MDQQSFKLDKQGDDGVKPEEPLRVYEDVPSYDEVSRKHKPMYQGGLFNPVNVRNLAVLLLVGGVSLVGVRAMQEQRTLDDRTGATNKVEILDVGGLRIEGVEEREEIELGKGFVVSAVVPDEWVVDRVVFVVDDEVVCAASVEPWKCELVLDGPEEDYEVKVVVYGDGERLGEESVWVDGVIQ